MNLQKPIRVSHTYRQRLKAPPEQVFPLLCPVREKEWLKAGIHESSILLPDMPRMTVSSLPLTVMLKQYGW